MKYETWSPSNTDYLLEGEGGLYDVILRTSNGDDFTEIGDFLCVASRLPVSKRSNKYNTQSESNYIYLYVVASKGCNYG